MQGMSARSPVPNTIAQAMLNDALVRSASQHRPDAPAVIEARGLVKHFGDIHAVNGIDLDVRRGQVFGFLGQNGSGKTTTVRMLTTLLRPTEGSARVAGFNVLEQDRQVRRAVGVALQEAGLDILQTGRELLRLQSRLYNVPRGEIEDRIAHLLDVVDLTEDADRRIGGYSGGMQRRLDLASALVHSPSIIFLDEPTTGLDPVSRQNLWEYIQRLNREDGVTFFLTTQYLEEADQLCDEIAILDAGEIVVQGTPDQLKATVSADVIYVQVDGDETQQQKAVAALLPLPNVEDARWDWNEGVAIYTKSGHETLPLVVRSLDDKELSFSNLRLARATLDDVFFKATGHRIEPGEQFTQAADGVGA